METKELLAEAQKLKEMALSFKKELKEAGIQQGYPEIIAIEGPKLLYKIVEELDDLVRRVERLEGIHVID